MSIFMIIRRLLLAIPLLFLGWIAVLAVVMRFSDGAPAAVVLFPGAALMKNLPKEASLIDYTPFSVTLASDATDFAHALYRRGAILVLPAGLVGCFTAGLQAETGR
ncbi:MAG: hypothetical protein AAF982_11460 [Pseudomonadota bacterium]